MIMFVPAKNKWASLKDALKHMSLSNSLRLSKKKRVMYHKLKILVRLYSMGIHNVLGYDLINSVVMTELSRNDWWCQKQ